MSTPETAKRIADFRNMVQGDPDDDLAHFRLGQALMDDGQYDEAIKSFERTLELTPGFSRVFQYMGECLIKAGQKDKAVEVLTKGWETANERGDRLPKEAMEKLLKSQGGAHPPGRCAIGRGRRTRDRLQVQAPGLHGGQARPTSFPPRRSPTRSASASTPTSAPPAGTSGSRTSSIKVINEMRLDLSSDFGQAEYDKHMRDFLGFEE